MTTIAAAEASVEGIKSIRAQGLKVQALQDFHA